MKKLFFLIVFIATTSTILAQSTCSDKLRLAQRNFDEGLLDDIPSLIDSCLKSGFTDEEKMNAYKLLVQTYLFNEQVEKADEVMLTFLRELPSYQITTSDLKEFINLYNTYQTEPLFKWEINASVTYTYPKVTEYFSVGDLNQSSTSYASKVGMQMGLSFTDKINNRWNWAAGVNATFYRMSYTGNQYNYSTTTANFTNLTIGIPISAKFTKSLWGVKTFVKGGFETTYLLSAKSDFERTFTNGDNPIINTEDMIEMNNKIDIRPFISIGVNIQIMNKYELVPSVGFKLSTLSSLNTENRIRNNELLYKYAFSGDNLQQNLLFVDIAFVIPYYNPRKIK